MVCQLDMFSVASQLNRTAHSPTLDEKKPQQKPIAAQSARPYQVAAVDAIEKRLLEDRSTLLVLPTGAGKCLGRGTLVMLHDGSLIAVEDVREGMLLMSPDEAPRIVLSTNTGVGELFQINPVKGEPWICNDVHVLTLVHTETGQLVDIPLDRYLKKSRYWKHCHKLWRCVADFQRANQCRNTLSPYFLGLWLGDGSLLGTAVRISKPDIEVRQACEEEAKRFGLSISVSEPDGKCPSIAIIANEHGRGKRNPVGREILELGLLASDRFVPDAYKYGTREVRLGVLAGLLDSDGHLENNGFDFISMYRRLSEDVVFIARSLGLAAYMAECKKGCQTGAVGVYWRVSISGETMSIPTRIPRKQATQRKQIKDVQRTGFTVSPLGQGEYFGFTLDGDGRFLLGDFTVTHNTFVFTEVIRRRPNDRVLVLAHRDELLQQARMRLAKELNEKIGLEQADSRSQNERVVVGSIQTMSMPKRLEAFHQDDFQMVVCDEAHHSPAPTWRRVLDYFRSAKILGVTATPDRADEKAMGQVFDSVAYDYEIEDAIRDGWLCDVVCTRVQIAGLDLSTVRTTAGDLNQGDLENVMKVEGVLQGIADVIFREAGNRKTLVFATSVDNAHRLAEILCRHREGCAMAVDGKTDREIRRGILNEHQDGKYQFLLNVGIATEGYDDPSISCVAIARPTKSRSLFAQMIGRGLRIYPGKSNCLVIDLAGNSGRHKLASALDILGGKYSEDEVDEANRIVAKKPGTSAREALDIAKAMLERKRQIEEAAARRKGVKAKAIYTKSPADLFRTLHMSIPNEIEAAGRFGGKPPTDKQIEYLEQLKMPIPDGITAQIASMLIEEAKRRKRENLASAKQVGLLSRYGIDGNTMDRGLAGKLMEFIIDKNRFQVTSDQVVRQLAQLRGDDF